MIGIAGVDPAARSAARPFRARESAAAPTGVRQITRANERIFVSRTSQLAAIAVAATAIERPLEGSTASAGIQPELATRGARLVRTALVLAALTANYTRCVSERPAPAAGIGIEPRALHPALVRRAAPIPTGAAG